MVILLQQENFGPNVIYFALGITEGRPAGAFGPPGFSNGGGTPRGGGAAPPESQDGGTEGAMPEAISQRVDPCGVDG